MDSSDLPGDLPTDLPAAVDSVMSTARAARVYRTDPVDRETLTEIVRAATWAPNPRNTQPWEFVVVDDPSIREQIGAQLAPRAAEVDAAAERLADPAKQRMYRGAADLIRSLGTAPALVFVCGRRRDYGPEFPAHDMVLSATYTAAQNLLLAARARGLGAAFTTLHLHANEAISGLLGLPDDVAIEVTIPVGYPARPFGPVRRRPVDEVLHWNGFDAT